MQSNLSILEQLSEDECHSLITHALRLSVEKDQTTFSTGDIAGYIYFIKSGSASVKLDQFNTQAKIKSIAIRAMSSF